MLQQLMALYKDKEYKNAVEIAQKLLRDDSKNLEALYILGLSASMISDHDTTISAFSHLLHLNPMYKKSVDLFLAISYKKRKMVDEAIGALSKCISKYDFFIPAYLYRAKLAYSKNDYEQAEIDLLKILDISKDHEGALLSLGDINFSQKKYRDAINYYLRLQAFPIKLILCYLALKEFKEADRIISERFPQTPEIMFLRAKVLRGMRNTEKAILLLEEIEEATPTFRSRCLKEIILIKLSDRDFYGAYHTAMRGENNKGVLEFLEGAINIIKRKNVDGILKMDRIIQGHSEIDEESYELILPLAYSFRAYSKFCIGHFEDAEKDYNKLEVIGNLGKGDEYNRELCQGVIKATRYEFAEAERHFRAADCMGISKIEPRFYLSILNIVRILRENPKQFRNVINAKMRGHRPPDFRDDIILEVYRAIDTLSSIYEENDSSSNISFYLGYFKLLVSMEHDSIEHFNVAMEKSDDNHSHHFLWKGISLAMCGNYEGAINEFRVSLSLDPEYYLGALYLSKAYLHIKDVNSAINELTPFMNGEAEECEAKMILGNYFFANGFQLHAEQMYTESLQIKHTEECIRELYKCYITEKNLVRGLECLNELINIAPLQEYQFDKTMLETLRLSSYGEFSKAENELQMILENGQEHGWGLIFKESDIRFYLGIISFYNGNIQSSLTQLSQSKILKYMNHTPEDYQDNLTLEYLIRGGSDDYLEGEPLVSQTFTELEITFNIAICYIICDKMDLAINSLEQIMKKSPYIEHLEMLLEVIKGDKHKLEELKTFMASEDIKDSPKQKSSEDKPGPFCFSIFKSSSRLCGIFPAIEIPICGEFVPIRLSFCLPSVSPPSTLISVDLEILRNLSITAIDNRPEAPWIKRNTEGIVFTNEVSNVNIFEVENVNELLQLLPDELNENCTVKQNAEEIFKNYKDPLMKSMSILVN